MWAELRKSVPRLAADRYLWPEPTIAVELLQDGTIADAAPAVVGELQ
jgi:hypothetical protein